MVWCGVVFCGVVVCGVCGMVVRCGAGWEYIETSAVTGTNIEKLFMMCGDGSICHGTGVDGGWGVCMG